MTLINLTTTNSFFNNHYLKVMKKLTSIFLIVTFLTGCSDNQNSKQKIEAAEHSTKVLVFPKELIGEWVLADYITSIEKTKSTVKSANKLKGIVAIYVCGIPKTDTMEVGANLNNHEGSSFRILLEKGTLPNSFKTDCMDFDCASNRYEIGIEKINNIKYLFMYLFNKSNRLIKKIKYTKIMQNCSENELANGLEVVVNKNLIAGTYQLIDSTNKATSITFNKNGTILGNSTLKNYYIFTDFIIGPMPEVDEIALNFRLPNQTNYLLKRKGNTMYLHETLGDGLPGGTALKAGKVVYKLIKN
jgi:hypothetical protein